MTEEVPNRRPLKTRSTVWAKLLTTKLVGLGVKPNQVSLASIGFAALGAVAFYAANELNGSAIKSAFYLIVIIGIQGRLLCNLLDGMLAIESGLKSKDGELYNEIPDRVSDFLLIFAAGASLPLTKSILLSGSTLGFFAAILAVHTAYIRAVGTSVGAKNLFIGPMAKQHRMATLTVACILSILENLTGSGFILFYFSQAIALWLIIIGSALTCVRRTEKIANFLRARPE